MKKHDAVHLALQSGIAGGADVILIPEITPQLTDVVIGNICQKIVSLRQKEREREPSTRHEAILQ